METEVNQQPVGNIHPDQDRLMAGSQAKPAGKWRPAVQWLLVLLPFLFLWGVLINQLKVEWQVNAQYSHGWIVPFLCSGLLLGRWQKKKDAALGSDFAPILPLVGGRTSGKWRIWVTAALFAFLAFLWLPTRLIEEANPDWRLISWLLALEVIGLTLGALWLQAGRGWAALFAFPLCFFLVAVPWPTLIEGPLIQLLTRICASCSVEVVGWLGIPAIQHGNVIEVASGTVGVDEACSGIRSFQSTLMISLFLGEYYELGLFRRIVLAPAGFLVALLFNIVRISFLTSVAAREGVSAISRYHDPAGLAIMIACVFALWLLALVFRGRVKNPPAANFRLLPRISSPPPGLKHLAMGLLVWLVAVELGVELWYRMHEWRLPPSAVWSVDTPSTNPTFSEIPIGEKTKRLLRYDEAVSASWREKDEVLWQMIYLRWLPGRTAVYLARNHTPEVCLAAAGHTVETLPDIAYYRVGGLNLPFRKYVVQDEGTGPSYVFYCLWEDRSKAQFFDTQFLTYGSRLDPVLAGQRNSGQRSLEIVVRGCRDSGEAEEAVIRELSQLIKVGQTGAAARKMSSRESGIHRD